MGSATSSIRKTFPRIPRKLMRSLNDYTSNAISEETAYQWHQLFHRCYKDGVMTQTEVMRIFITYFPTRDADLLYECLVRQYAEDSSDKVDYLTFMKALFHVCPLGIDLRMIPFKAFDTDCDDKINKEGVRDIMIKNYQLIGLVTNPFESARAYIINLFGATKGDTKLTVQQYIKGGYVRVFWTREMLCLAMAAICNQLANYSPPQTPETVVEPLSPTASV